MEIALSQKPFNGHTGSQRWRDQFEDLVNKQFVGLKRVLGKLRRRESEIDAAGYSEILAEFSETSVRLTDFNRVANE
eukprot:7376556-Lingulodinium_polyedra.AAC.1